MLPLDFSFRIFFAYMHFLHSIFLLQRMFRIFFNLSTRVYNKLERTIPGFNKIMEQVNADAAAREAKRRERREAQKKVEEEVALFGRVQK